MSLFSMVYYPEAGGYAVITHSWRPRKRVHLILAKLALCPRTIVIDVEREWA